MKKNWEYVYDSQFAYVYDRAYDEAVCLELRDDKTLTLSTTDNVVLDKRGIESLRKLLQSAERYISKE